MTSKRKVQVTRREQRKVTRWTVGERAGVNVGRCSSIRRCGSIRRNVRLVYHSNHSPRVVRHRWLVIGSRRVPRGLVRTVATFQPDKNRRNSDDKNSGNRTQHGDNKGRPKILRVTAIARTWSATRVSVPLEAGVTTTLV